MPFLSHLSEDVISIILDYLNSKEFIRIVYMTTKKCCISGSIIRKETIKHLKQTWNISDKYLSRFIQYYSHGSNHNHIDFKSYLPYAIPIMESLRLSDDHSNNSDLILINNQSVKFNGIVGISNRSVVSSQSFPAGTSTFLKILTDMEQAMKHRSLSELVNIMKRVKSIILDQSRKSDFQTLADFSSPIFSSPFLYKSRTLQNRVGSSGYIGIDNSYMSGGSHVTSWNNAHMEVSSSLSSSSSSLYHSDYTVLTRPGVNSKSISRASSFNSFQDGSIDYKYRIQSYLLPRSIAYFEVKITKNQQISTNQNTDMFMLDHIPIQLPVADPPIECVAVGLSTSAFDIKDKMPGWDCESYGYHGDDGGIFYGNGHKFDEYGPAFGPGDIVGCGLDYKRKEIFYTLNGSYLGPAFLDVNIGSSYFPTVGIDAYVSVTFNFGCQPFEYDLAGHIEREYDNHIESHY